jgi:sialate O-acetylesterase
MIGQLGIFPPHYESAYNAQITYAIPENLLNLKGENVIAIRVYDENGEGGLVSGPLLIGYDSDYDLLSQDLSGNGN